MTRRIRGTIVSIHVNYFTGNAVVDIDEDNGKRSTFVISNNRLMAKRLRGYYANGERAWLDVTSDGEIEGFGTP